MREFFGQGMLVVFAGQVHDAPVPKVNLADSMLGKHHEMLPSRVRRKIEQVHDTVWAAVCHDIAENANGNLVGRARRGRRRNSVGSLEIFSDGSCALHAFRQIFEVW